MSKAKIFKYKEQWRIREHGKTSAVDLESSHIEKYFGVLGGPKVVVYRACHMGEYQIEIRNGFLTQVTMKPPLSNPTDVSEFHLDPLNL